ncbi:MULTISPECIES: hypothetical protein [Acidobacterium]|uniref:CopG family transcriptional regulator n=1 Tax=Acidobacterium capsulatum (strain ATCC 51196 / DSM 11244 / BCRC 80197 / JCM 7670 / NBRC 15755 / NCIMB 13165 / 161) TaxID=240015 RepID=C1F3P7_ACIC5|nr:MULTISPECIES: hypothetical protein [Acidobacterium]ACO33292.1 conserved hypothetical protein [Acidobacterium capsulatum ATCC 51196]HCT60575.1 antitoxin [Acidobacterium sp.]
MRTTLALDDDVFEEVRSYAEARDLPLGRAVTELLRRAMVQPAPTRRVNGLLVFDLPADSSPVTDEMVRDLESEI